MKDVSDTGVLKLSVKVGILVSFFYEFLVIVEKDIECVKIFLLGI